MAAIDPTIAERAAELRADHAIRLPEPFKLAAAIKRGATHIITNEAWLKKITEIRVLVLDDCLPACASILVLVHPSLRALRTFVSILI